MASADTAIEAQDLVKTYPKGVNALDGLSISVPRCMVFGLLGPNGAGKSTTIKILTTLSRPDSGSAQVAGVDVLNNPAGVRRVIGCVTQKSGVDMESTGYENLSLQGRLYGMSGAALHDRAMKLLDRFALSQVANRVARTYSGGMQRKLDIAMGLIHLPEVLFLDEPTTGLDPEARKDLWSEISQLAGEGLTILLTTHYLEEADRLAAQLAIVDHGRVVAGGTPSQMKAELEGDSVEIDFADPPDEAAARAALAPLSAVHEVVVSGSELRARAANAAAAAPAILAALEAAGLRAASVTISRPTLDDVYLRHTGRTFEQAEAAQPAAAPGGWR